MKYLKLVIFLPLINACVMVPLDYQSSRITPARFNDNDVLEELMQNEPALIIETYRSL